MRDFIDTSNLAWFSIVNIDSICGE